MALISGSNYNLTDGSMGWPSPSVSGDLTQRLSLGKDVIARDQSTSDFGDAELLYVKFTTACNQGDFIVADRYAKTAVQATQAAGTAARGGLVGVAMATQVINSYGYILIRGVYEFANLLTASAAAAPLYLTAVAGQATGASAPAGFRIDSAQCKASLAAPTGRAWVASTAYTSGQRVTNGTGVNLGAVYQCVVSGTSAASGGPNAPVLNGVAIVDNTAQWQFIGVFTPLTTFGIVELGWASFNGNT